MKHPLASLAGAPLAWLAHFVAVYGAASLVCAAQLRLPWPATAATVFLVVLLTMAGLALAAAGLLRNRARLRQAAGDLERFAARTNLLLYALAAVGMLWVGLPALLLPSCA
jgi:hypothetical protein